MSGEAPPRGLPEHLPAGERILWQGAPAAAGLARAAFHTRGVAIYFAGLTALAVAVSAVRGTTPTGALATAGCGLAALVLLHLLAWAQARAAVYTLTDRRLVLRIGVALPTSINIPLDRIAAIDLSTSGDIALTLAETPALGWIVLWPHARPWRVSRPVPMLRCVADAEDAAHRIGQACADLLPVGRLRDAPVPQPQRIAVPA